MLKVLNHPRLGPLWKMRVWAVQCGPDLEQWAWFKDLDDAKAFRVAWGFEHVGIRRILLMVASRRPRPRGSPTGRLHKSEPNLQQIPIRTPEGRAIREAFLNDKG